MVCAGRCVVSFAAYSASAKLEHPSVGSQNSELQLQLNELLKEKLETERVNQMTPSFAVSVSVLDAAYSQMLTLPARCHRYFTLRPPPPAAATYLVKTNKSLEAQLYQLRKLDRPDRTVATASAASSFGGVDCNDDDASSVGSVGTATSAAHSGGTSGAGGLSAPSEYASVISGDVANLIADTVLHEEGGPMTKLISRMIHLRDERDKYEVGCLTCLCYKPRKLCTRANR